MNDRLSQKVRGELDNEAKQQALFSLLGRQYVRIHFPHHKWEPELLEPPRTKPEVSQDSGGVGQRGASWALPEGYKMAPLF